ncbi:FAD/NAD(P)-binding oxidoreductase family protein [Euphorbia peplus]|nr:FAD/NAD(P)-binding oxidoreductase family protein [Euphorbia peplus]
MGFLDSIIQRFFTSFLVGIFFDRELETTSRLFNFIFKCLTLGENTLSANGIGAIPNQLAAKLPENSILLNTRVASVDFDESNWTRSVRLENKEIIESEIGVILVVEEPEADKLLAGKNIKSIQKNPARSTTCVYFSLDPGQIPVKDSALFLRESQPRHIRKN